MYIMERHGEGLIFSYNDMADRHALSWMYAAIYKAYHERNDRRLVVPAAEMTESFQSLQTSEQTQERAFNRSNGTHQMSLSARLVPQPENTQFATARITRDMLGTAEYRNIQPDPVYVAPVEAKVLLDVAAANDQSQRSTGGLSELDPDVQAAFEAISQNIDEFSDVIDR